ncbi:aryl-sulfate sulfotransferase [Halococcus salsus]|uniref:aryl-sulfate sulfotransferase n=1 Tax=Halococcus salsus TaxID=2162894 RepID=UPI001359DA38|nr:aryl-sulfate sulfotransferase [Halococcus salsus]
MSGLPTLRWLVRGILGISVVSLFLFSGVLTFAYDAPTRISVGAETTSDSATIVSTQGWNARNISLPGRPAQLVSIGPDGEVNWKYNGTETTQNWFYDVDPLPNGNLLVVNPKSGTTVVYEFNPKTQQRVWTEQFKLSDIHDIDLINGDELLVAGINYDTTSVSNDSVFIYNTSTSNVTWEWRFKNHYPDDADNGVSTKDWTHVNDVDKISNKEYLVSVRNMDQVISINRSTKKIEMQLGSDDNYTILNEQHNPTYLESKDGNPTILVADSENDRIVEYERTGGPDGAGDWNRTWTLTGDLNWPRDADRLPNGNTLVTDTMNSRVIEVTPTGDVVWEAYVPWATYDAERFSYGDEAGGPTIQDQEATGSVTVSGANEVGVEGVPAIPALTVAATADTPLQSQVTDLAERWRRVSPWFKPVWMPIWAFTTCLIALLLLIIWIIGEGAYQRYQIWDYITDAVRKK